MTTTATATLQSTYRSNIAAAMHRLLDSLRPFMRAYAETAEAQKSLPELDIVWVTGVDDGPETAILDAIRSTPDLWSSAIPNECCVVPRDVLRKLLGEAAADGLVMHGAAMVENHAARFAATLSANKG